MYKERWGWLRSPGREILVEVRHPEWGECRGVLEPPKLGNWELPNGGEWGNPSVWSTTHRTHRIGETLLGDHIINPEPQTAVKSVRASTIAPACSPSAAPNGVWDVAGGADSLLP